MTPIKVWILFEFHSGAWGGGNQFLKALRDELDRTNNLAASPHEADAVLFNSFNDALEVIKLKRRLQDKYFIHRVDGPVSIYRGRDFHVDQLIHALNFGIADGTIFQSNYSRSANFGLGMIATSASKVILNAASKYFICPTDTATAAPCGRVRLIASSWSQHPNKGFDIYQHLDRTLDWSRFEMTFVGNSPFKFSNIRQLPAQPPDILADLLRAHDIYITGSRHESCSNALLEALASGLPAVAIDSGSNSELVGLGGITYTGTSDVSAAIEQAALRLLELRGRVTSPSIVSAGDSYREFVSDVVKSGKAPKKISSASAASLFYRVLTMSLHAKISSAASRLRSVTAQLCGAGK